MTLNSEEQWDEFYAVYQRTKTIRTTKLSNTQLMTINLRESLSPGNASLMRGFGDAVDNHSLKFDALRKKCESYLWTTCGLYVVHFLIPSDSSLD
jgi:hypothetical protein